MTNAEDATPPLGLTDELAVGRTRLANERTLLAYWRSSVALVIAGVSIVHFADRGWFVVFGFACLPAGAVAAWIGWVRYRRMERAVVAMCERHRVSVKPTVN